MASSYSLYEMTQFPGLEAGQHVQAIYQGTLFDDIERPPETNFVMRRRIPELDADVFRVHYEHIANQAGRARGTTFTKFVAQNTFPAYYIRDKQLMLVKSPKSLARGAMRVLVRSAPDVAGSYRRFDLDSIQDRIRSFKAAYFSVEDSTDVSSVALFGSSVEQDFRFSRAASEGGMKHVRFDYRYEEEVFFVGISEDSVVVLFDSYLDEFLELQLVLELKERLLDHAVDKI